MVPLGKIDDCSFPHDFSPSPLRNHRKPVPRAARGTPRCGTQTRTQCTRNHKVVGAAPVKRWYDWVTSAHRCRASRYLSAYVNQMWNVKIRKNDKISKLFTFYDIFEAKITHHVRLMTYFRKFDKVLIFLQKSLKSLRFTKITYDEAEKWGKRHQRGDFDAVTRPKLGASRARGKVWGWYEVDAHNEVGRWVG